MHMTYAIPAKKPARKGGGISWRNNYSVVIVSPIITFTTPGREGAPIQYALYSTRIELYQGRFLK